MRFLATVLRYLNRRRVIEIGTAYGLGALAMARTGGDDIRIATASAANRSSRSPARSSPPTTR